MITYLVLIIVLVSLEIGCGVAVLVRRNSLHDNTNSLIDAMYTTNSVNDLKIIQDKVGSEKLGIFNNALIFSTTVAVSRTHYSTLCIAVQCPKRY